MLVLPIAIGEGWTPPVDRNPAGWLLLLLTATLGLPFFVVAASAPLMQKWFSALGHERSHDPYFLYAASNAGSMTALLAYPVIVEPTLNLPEQSRLWSVGYGLFIILTVTCAALVTLRGPADDYSGRPALRGRLPLGRMLRWVALAAVPSSLLLGVTTFITTDLVAAPLLWIIPLALYLLTCILVFARNRLIPHAIVVRLLPPAAIVLLVMLLMEATEPMLLIVAGHLAAFFILAMACHGELVNDRPETAHLTTFYLMIGLGGLLGGAFNALLAPQMFTSVAEYPIAIAAAAILMFRPLAFEGRSWLRESDVALPAIIGAAAIGLLVLADRAEMEAGPLRFALTIGLPAIACYVISRRHLRFGLALGAVFLAGSFDTINRGNVLEAHRSFFGVHRITRAGEFNHLYHGTTLHGKQWIEPETGRPSFAEPLAYYHRQSPIGEVFAAYQEAGRLSNVGLVGLGVGALAAYGEPGQRFTFFEIDPVVKRIAEDVSRFGFINDARLRGVEVPIVLGDARLTLAKVPSASFDLLVLDAFSSDSIPVHLLTREAIELYLHAVADGGVIALHISNRYLDLEPIVAGAAAALDLICIVRYDTAIEPEELLTTGRVGSIWAVLARSPDDLQPLLRSPATAGWVMRAAEPDVSPWTDDYSNILRAIRW